MRFGWLLLLPLVRAAPAPISLSVDGPVVLGADAATLADAAREAVVALRSRAHECLDREVTSGAVWLQVDHPSGDAPPTLTATPDSPLDRDALGCLKAALEPLRDRVGRLSAPARVAIGVRYGASADAPPPSPAPSPSPPPVPTDTVTLVGPLSPDEIASVIGRATPLFRVCYQRELTRHPDLAGRVVVRFTITTDGTVASPTLSSSTLGSPTVEACIVDAFGGLRFPVPRGGGVVRVNFPLELAPE